MLVQSCDTFVALPPATNGCVIFAKNSDRPASEVQEVVHVNAQHHEPGSKLQTTFIEIDQVELTHGVILSKPAWTWGAEMGANEHGVCIGNEAIFTTLCDPEDVNNERLLGMDYVRLGLERSHTAKEAVDVISGLLETHGQGGPCFEDPSYRERTYHNSFLIADSSEAWVLETAGKLWVAKKITDGVRNISNQLSVGDDPDAKCGGISDGVHFSKTYQAEFKGITFSEKETPSHRYESGKALMEKAAEIGNFDTLAMFEILRNKESGICRTGSVSTVGSQVSVLYPGSSKPHCHWFTATPNPCLSFFKPFIFCPGADIGDLTVSPSYGADDPVKATPRFQKQVDRQHTLYRQHREKMDPLGTGEKLDKSCLETLQLVEKSCVNDMQSFLDEFDASKLAELKDIFVDAVASEMKFYD